MVRVAAFSQVRIPSPITSQHCLLHPFSHFSMQEAVQIRDYDISKILYVKLWTRCLRHQGIMERGSKTGSGAYLLLPCRLGAFTVVMGKHYKNFDSSDFPFSYITEEKGRSELTPAMNIFTVGTRRDSEKWASRDIRELILISWIFIHFDLFNPVYCQQYLK